MNAEHAQRNTGPSLRAWFDQALRQPEDRREAWLTEHCQDAGLRQAVRELLAQHATEGEPWSKPIGSWFLAFDGEAREAEEHPAALVGRTIADFKLLRPLGSGGMASVYLAERVGADFQQFVAIKILRYSLFSTAEARMFRRERQLLATLDHPNIARLIDGGVSETGLLYLVLEYVDGQPITRFCATHRVGLREQVEMIIAVCRAVEHAHRSSIIHRDIKPANVLVTEEGVVKLLDFGIAKLLQNEEFATQTVDVFMTPEYAAPEQFRKHADSPAVDVYALGTLLHELLLGVRPDREHPARPSTLIEAQRGETSGAVPRDPDTLRRFLRGDLDNIIERATQADPMLRYRNAGELADDLRRFLDGEPVLAHPPSAWYRTRKFMLKHRGAVGVSLVLLLGLIGSLALAAWQGMEARRQADQAERARAQAEQESLRANAVLRFVLGVFESAQEVAPEQDRLAPAQLLSIAQTRLEQQADLPALTRARMWQALGQISNAMSDFAGAKTQFEQALHVLDDQSGSDAQALRADIHRALAGSREDAGDAREALRLLNEHVHPEALTDAAARYDALSTLTETYFDLGDAEQALRSAERAAAAGREAFPANSREALLASLIPARTQSLLGQHAQALPELERGVQRWQELKLPQDTEYVHLEAAIGVAYFSLGQADLGQQWSERALTDDYAVHRGPSATAVKLMENAANMQGMRGDEAGARARLEQALKAATQIYPPQSPVLISLRLSLAMTLARTAEADQARTAYEAVRQACADYPDGAQLADCGRVHISLGNLLVRLGKLDAARDEIEAGLAHQQRLHGERHPTVAAALMVLGNLHIQQRDWPAAQSAFDRAQAIFAEHHVGDARIGRLQLARAQVQYRLGNAPDALAAVNDAIANLDQYLTQDHATRALAYAWQSLIASRLGNAALARQAVQQARTLDADIAGKLPADLRAALP